jgi:hypothetical protein
LSSVAEESFGCRSQLLKTLEESTNQRKSRSQSSTSQVPVRKFFDEHRDAWFLTKAVIKFIVKQRCPVHSKTLSYVLREHGIASRPQRRCHVSRFCFCSSDLAIAMHHIRDIFLVLLGISLFIAASFATNAITLQVEPQTEECFYVNNPANTQDSYSITFTVIRGGKLDIYLQVRGQIYFRYFIHVLPGDPCSRTAGH